MLVANVFVRLECITNVTDAIRRMMGHAGLNPSKLSLQMGKSRAYVASALSHETVPKVDTLARMAHACGYRLVLESPEDEIELYTEEDYRSFVSDAIESLADKNGNVKVDDLIKAMRDYQVVYSPGRDSQEPEAAHEKPSERMKSRAHSAATADGAANAHGNFTGGGVASPDAGDPQDS